MQHYSLGMLCKAGDDSRNYISPECMFRPTLIRVSVDEPGLAVIKRIIFGNVDQLVCEVDAWNWSIKLAKQNRDDFLREHGLAGKTPAEIDTYLDDNELSIPDPGRMMLPTIKPNENITIIGDFKADTRLFFFGVGH